MNTGFVRPVVATALTVYGIETLIYRWRLILYLRVATALTVYGIETTHIVENRLVRMFKLQQHLPFTVLKLNVKNSERRESIQLQQHLPFTVLKLLVVVLANTSAIWLQQHLPFTVLKL